MGIRHSSAVVTGRELRMVAALDPTHTRTPVPDDLPNDGLAVVCMTIIDGREYRRLKAFAAELNKDARLLRSISPDSPARDFYLTANPLDEDRTLEAAYGVITPLVLDGIISEDSKSKWAERLASAADAMEGGAR